MFSLEQNCPPPDFEEMIQLSRILPQIRNVTDERCFFFNMSGKIWLQDLLRNDENVSLF